MNKYLLASAELTPRTALADSHSVTIESLGGSKTSLTKVGDDFIYTYTSFKGEERTLVLKDCCVYDLPELIAIMAMENPNMFCPIIIAKTETVVTLFPNK